MNDYEKVCRREVPTSRSEGVYSDRVTYGMRNLCQDCAIKFDQQQAEAQRQQAAQAAAYQKQQEEQKKIDEERRRSQQRSMNIMLAVLLGLPALGCLSCCFLGFMGQMLEAITKRPDRREKTDPRARP